MAQYMRPKAAHGDIVEVTMSDGAKVIGVVIEDALLAYAGRLLVKRTRPAGAGCEDGQLLIVRPEDAVVMAKKGPHPLPPCDCPRHSKG